MKHWGGKCQVKSIIVWVLSDTYLVIPPMLIQQGDDGLDVALGYQI